MAICDFRSWTNWKIAIAGAGSVLNIDPFSPSAGRVEELSGRISAKLAASLRYIEQFCLENGVETPDLGRVWDRLEREKIRPSTFSAYFDLVKAVESKRWDSVAELFEEIASFAPWHQEQDIKVIDLENPAASAWSRRYECQINSDEDDPIRLAPPSAEEADAAVQKIRMALETMKEAAPDLWEETRALVYEIVLAVPVSETRVFNGTSAFEFLGAVVYNPQRMFNLLDAALNIVHESCHQLLFRLGHEELLVLNPRSELHASPLRDDPRPLEGIYHATVVIARMHYLLGKLRGADRWAEEELDFIGSEMRRYEEKFRDGVDVLDKHARYGGGGEAMLNSAKAYMGSVAER